MDIAIKELPTLPEEWVYETSVVAQNERRDIILKWSQTTVDFLNELYVAREKLTNPEFYGNQWSGTNVPHQTWAQYCEDIGIEKRTANRWLKRHFKPLEIEAVEQVEVIIPEGVFSVIYADPPWEYANSGFQMSAAKQYPTMPTGDIAAMDVQGVSADDAICFMWVTNPLLKDGLHVLHEWGFEYKTNFVWVKNNHTAGFYVYGQHELLLIGVRGSMLPHGDKPKSIITGSNSVHSKKPDSVRQMIEEMYPGHRYLELFARQKTENWEVFGNEV
jgi:N6-adenosine-specific RNA methylase IME4